MKVTPGRSARIAGWTKEDVLRYVGMAGYLNPDMLSLNEKKIGDFFVDPLINMNYELIAASLLTPDYLSGDSAKGSPIKGKLRFGHVYFGIPVPALVAYCSYLWCWISKREGVRDQHDGPFQRVPQCSVFRFHRVYKTATYWVA
jgi:hypothetical protein